MFMKDNFVLVFLMGGWMDPQMQKPRHSGATAGPRGHVLIREAEPGAQDRGGSVSSNADRGEAAPREEQSLEHGDGGQTARSRASEKQQGARGRCQQERASHR